ncbi:hypothetical protein DRO64_03160 [Candidatus Bathyarchaeota archaeon]|nr:MAG: hypothetical protein DRO64_03160 [Candidatus Bathyarchaeota archaeon]
MEYLNPVLVGIFASFIASYLTLRIHLYSSQKIKYSLARLFLRKNETVKSLKILIVSLIVFASGRMISMLILLNVLEESAIYYIRVPIDLVVTILLTYSLMILYNVIKPREVRLRSSDARQH